MCARNIHIAFTYRCPCESRGGGGDKRNQTKPNQIININKQIIISNFHVLEIKLKKLN